MGIEDCKNNSPSFFALGANDCIVQIERPGRSPLLYLATTPDAYTLKIGAILFVGSDGMVNLANKESSKLGTDNFLVRSRNLFTQEGLVTATFDPSADSGALSDEARMSKLHAEEVEEVLIDFKNRFQLEKVYLIGTSRGTISAAHLAVRFNKKISGVILTSTVFSGNRKRPGLSGFNFSEIQVPLLFVHHRYDACKVTPPSAAENMNSHFPVIFIEGGVETDGHACGALSAHGYLGCEKEAVKAISDWIFK